MDGMLVITLKVWGHGRHGVENSGRSEASQKAHSGALSGVGTARSWHHHHSHLTFLAYRLVMSQDEDGMCACFSTVASPLKLWKRSYLLKSWSFPFCPSTSHVGYFSA